MCTSTKAKVVKPPPRKPKKEEEGKKKEEIYHRFKTLSDFGGNAKNLGKYNHKNWQVKCLKKFTTKIISV